MTDISIQFMFFIGQIYLLCKQFMLPHKVIIRITPKKLILFIHIINNAATAPGG